ncbi:hypothetical protein [Motilibacter aurantiacus]|uniref:hypothetical protein n=1 Tax=Motilibacter aurantiacus TaxID=2714955 RepID=UPI0014091710|nr:hypothetical protein [Motilibacter aurantiacus]NHC47197.1 hypothetical protein [Motilibacter aurantiacus]
MLPTAPGWPVAVVRQNEEAPYEYAALVRLTPPARITVSMTGPTGATASVPVLVQA